MTDEIATPDHSMRLDDCTAAHIEYMIAHRKYLHAITDRPYTADCWTPSTTCRYSSRRWPSEAS